MTIQPLPIPSGATVAAVLPQLRAALKGGPPVLPYAASSPVPDVPVHDPATLPPDLALVVGTSGSTGVPKLAMLTATALRASANATHEVLGGPGQWLLAMPGHHVAGIQVLVRSVLAGSVPVAVDVSEGFTAAAFAAGSRRLKAARRYTAIVPTQLVRLLEDYEGLEALRSFDRVLVGGAGTPARLRRRAYAAGVHLVATYGMSETAGGCVYDGRPLPVSRVRLDPDGRVHLGGATLAHGYLGRPELSAEAFGRDHAGAAWFRTDDAGRLGQDGRLQIDGRLDDMINTGGLKVAPRLVEEAVLDHLDGVREAVVVGVEDPEWGQSVCLALVTAGPAPTVGEVRSRLRGILPGQALPRRVLAVTEIPMRGPGKPDRRALIARFSMGQ